MRKLEMMADLIDTLKRVKHSEGEDKCEYQHHGVTSHLLAGWESACR